MTKLWAVTVNGVGMVMPTTYYTTSRKEAEKIAELFECSDGVEYAGNFSDQQAEMKLERSRSIREKIAQDQPQKKKNRDMER